MVAGLERRRVRAGDGTVLAETVSPGVLAAGLGVDAVLRLVSFLAGFADHGLSFLRSEASPLLGETELVLIVRAATDIPVPHDRRIASGVHCEFIAVSSSMGWCPEEGPALGRPLPGVFPFAQNGGSVGLGPSWVTLSAYAGASGLVVLPPRFFSARAVANLRLVAISPYLSETTTTSL